MDLVFVTVDVVALSLWCERRVAAAEDESCRKEKNSKADGYENDFGYQDLYPLAEGASVFSTPCETLFFFFLAICHDPVCYDDPDADKEGPDHTSNANPAFLDAEAGYGKDHDHVKEKEDRGDKNGDLSCLRRGREE